MSETVWEKLAAPFHQSDVKYRIQALNGDQALLLPYVDARAVASRLDSCLGVDGWEDDYEEWQAPTVPLDPETAKLGGYRTWWSSGKKQGEPDAAATADLIQAHYQKSVKCTLKCWSEEKSRWITKHGIADNTEVEGVKGGSSQALRRAGVQYGIGRYLYDLKDIWIQVVVGNRPAGDGWEWTKFGRNDVFYRKPDLRNFGAGDPGTGREVIPITLGTPGATIPGGEGNTVTSPGTGQGGNQNTGAPSAISEPEMQDLLERISRIVQGNKESLENYRQINDQPDSLNKVSKMLGCLYFVAAQNVPSGQYESRIQQVMINKNFGEMYSALKDILADMESGVYR